MFEDRRVCIKMEGSTFRIYELNLWVKIVGIVIPLLVVIVNSIQIHVLRKTSHKPFYEKILFSMTICDLINGVLSCFCVPLDLTIKTEFYNLLYWNIWWFWICYWTLGVLLHLIVIGIDRLWALAKPFHHRIYHTHRKLVVAVALSWCLPWIFIIFHIILVISKGMNAKEAYSHIMIFMRSDVAKIIAIADIILIAIYCSIIGINYSTNNAAMKNRHSNQANSKRTLLLCVGIVVIYIVFTAPFIVVHVIRWNSPHWLDNLGTLLAPMIQISNSVLYLSQKYRTRQSSNTSRRNTRNSVASVESRL